ncbi:hypothetical protein D3C72_2455540 [compost metagenome]
MRVETKELIVQFLRDGYPQGGKGRSGDPGRVAGELPFGNPRLGQDRFDPFGLATQPI